MRLEWRQPELVSTVLHSEDAEQEAVHAEQHTTPQEYSKLLSSRVLDPWNLESERNGRKSQDTVNTCDDLRLESELIAETSSEVANASLAIARNVRCLSDVVEHVATREEENGDQANCSPEVAILDNGDDIGRSNSDECNKSKDADSYGDDLDPIDGAGDRGLGDITGDLAGNPGMDLFGRLWAVYVSYLARLMYTN